LPVSAPSLTARQLEGQTTGLNQVEYAYHLMAADAGLEVATCRLLDVDGLVHFLTRRFDRPTATTRLHVQSLAAMVHLPPENPGAHSYEQFLQTCLRLGLGAADRRQAFRMMVFNLAAAVRDDHTKNVAFLFDGSWRLAPAFDLTFPFLDGGGWLTHHQMTVGGSRSGAPRSVLLDIAERAKVVDPTTVIDEVVSAVRRWREHAEVARVLPEHIALISDELAGTTLAG
jgi:serine/threonine-protein kinase HipA